MRKTLWQYTLTQVETADPHEGDKSVKQEVTLHRDVLKSQVDASGNALLRGKQVQGKLMSKMANLLYRELKCAIALK